MYDLIKVALSPAALAGMGRAVKGFGAGAGMGGLVGAGVGGAAGGVQGYRRAQEQGASGEQALLGGLLGAGHGAALGGVAGAGGGALVGALRPGAAEALTAARGLRGASHFGQRQVHALTGVGDAAYVRSIGGGAAGAQKTLDAAQRAKQQAAQGYSKAQRGFQAAEKAEQMGLTSLPGYARALAKDPVGTLRTGIQEQWHGSGGALGKGLVYGLPLAGAVGAAAHGGKDEEGRGRFERTGRNLGFGASMALGPIPIAGQLAAGPVAGGAGGFIGRGLDQFLARRGPGPSAGSSSLVDGRATPNEYVVSNRASGAISGSPNR